MRCERHKDGWLIETAESLGSFVFILCRGENCVFEAKEEKLILERIFFVCFYCSLEFVFFLTHGFQLGVVQRTQWRMNAV